MAETVIDTAIETQSNSVWALIKQTVWSTPFADLSPAQKFWRITAWGMAGAILFGCLTLIPHVAAGLSMAFLGAKAVAAGHMLSPIACAAIGAATGFLLIIIMLAGKLSWTHLMRKHQKKAASTTREPVARELTTFSPGKLDTAHLHKQLQQLHNLPKENTNQIVQYLLETDYFNDDDSGETVKARNQLMLTLAGKLQLSPQQTLDSDQQQTPAAEPTIPKAPPTNTPKGRLFASWIKSCGLLDKASPEVTADFCSAIVSHTPCI